MHINSAGNRYADAVRAGGKVQIQVRGEVKNRKAQRCFLTCVWNRISGRCEDVNLLLWIHLYFIRVTPVC